MKKATVIIPAYNSHKTLPKVLDALVNQDYPNFEVIVMDDYPPKPVDYIVKKYKNFKYMPNDTNLGLSKSINRGIRASKSEVVIILHDDCVPQSSKWISGLMNSFTDDKVAIVISNVVYTFDNVTTPNKIFSYVYGLGTDKKIAEKQKGLVEVKNIGDKADAYRRDILEEIGMFNEQFKTANEDTYLSNMVLRKGYKILENRELLVEHIFSETERQNNIKTHLKKALQLTKQSIILFLKFRVNYNVDNAIALLMSVFSFLYFVHPMADIISVIILSVFGLLFHRRLGIYSLLLLALLYYSGTIWMDIPLKGAIIGLSYFLIKGTVKSLRYVTQQKKITLVLPIIMLGSLWDMIAGYGWIKGALLYFLKR